MSNVPTNLIPTRITGLPEYTGTSTLGYIPYILEGNTYKVQFGQLAAVGAVPSSRVVAAGTGLTGGGDLSENRVISIANGGVGYDQLSATGVVAGTYGSGSAIPVVTVDLKGRVTDVSTTPLVITGYVPDSRLISTGAGLLGGGSLASNRTLSVDFSSATPQALGSATAGVSNAAARGDHVHPAVDLSDANQTQGALPLGRGGTGDALSPVAGAVVYSTGTKFALADPGEPGQLLTSNGTGEPYWSTVTGTGTVTSVSVLTANGFAGSVQYANTTPQITINTTVTGLVKGNGSALSAAVPGVDYAMPGANSDITSLSGITGGISTPDYIDFDTAATVTRATGRLWWDNADGNQTLSLGMAGSNATLQIGEEMYFRIKASAAITEGQVVMFTGTVGNSGALTGAPATGLTKDTASYVMGVATEDIALNGWGYVTQFGLVRGLDTTGGAEAWVDGQILYYNPAVPGGLTKTVPTAPAAKVEMAAVVKAGTNGSLFIRPIARFSLTQLNDVESAGASNLDLLQYNGTGGYWEHKSPTTISVGTATNLAGGAANRIAYQTGAGATGFISAPVTPNTFLEWSGSAFQWSSNPLGTVTSVAMSVPTGLTVSGSPITTSGTLAVGLQSGYSIPTTASQANWDTAYSDRLQWDGGSTNLVAATGRTSLGLGTAAVLNAGVANGVATLDSAGTVPTSQLPAAVLGALNYQGVWNASTNTPTLTSSVGTKGYYYVVDVAGSTDLNGITDWKIGDWAVYNGTVWQKIDNTDGVTSVNGYTGAVSLTYSDVGAPSTTGTGASGTWNISVTGNAANVTGVVGVANGGTGATSLSSGYLLKGNGTSAVSASVIYDDGTNIGIGTSSPTSKFVVSNSGAAGFEVNPIGSASAPALYSYNRSTNAYDVLTTLASEVRWQTGASPSERMRLDASGNLGIGVTPTGAKLQVNGGVSVQGNSVPTSGSGMELLWDGSQSVVQSYNRTSSNYLPLWLEAGSYMRFGIAGTERMRIDSAGNVGIGTSSPSARLTLQETAASPTALNMLNRNSTQQWALAVDGAAVDDKLLAFIDQTNSAVRMALDASGNLGLGATPSAWGTAYKAMQFAGQGVSVFGSTVSSIAGFGSNGYYDGTNWVRNNSDSAGQYQIAGNVHRWYNAAAGSSGTTISFTQAMTLGGTAAPYLLVGTATNLQSYAFQAPNTNGMSVQNVGATLNIAQFAGGGSTSLSSTGNFAVINGADGILFGNTAGSERARIDSNGNLGLGVVPSAWSGFGLPVLELPGGGTIVSAGNGSTIGVNWYYDGSFRYKTSAAASYYFQTGGAHQWHTAPSGTAGNTISFTQAMTLDASGNLLVGTTTPAYSTSGRGLIEVNGSSSAIIAVKTGDTARGYFGASTTLTELSAVGASQPLAFTTNGAERMRIDSSGNVGIGLSTPSDKLHVYSGSQGTATFEGFYSFGDENYNIRLKNDGSTYGYLSQNPASGGIVVANGMRYYGGGPWTPDSTVASSFQQSGGNFIFTSNTGLTGGVNFTPTERMRIDTSGNVGIGATSYSARLAAQVNSGNYIFDLINGSETAFALRTYNHGSSPDSVVFTQGLFYGTTENTAIKFYRGGSAVGGFMAFTTNNAAEAMRITSGGYVGIGTTNPTSKLKVYGAAGNSPTIINVQHDAAGNTFDYGSVSATSNLGTVGITSWATGSARAGTGWVQTTGAIPLVVGVNDSEVARFDTSGNFGIGTTTIGARITAYNSTAGNAALFSAGSGIGTSFTLAAPGVGGAYMFTAAAGDTVMRTEANSLCIATASTIKIGTPSAEWARFDTNGNLGIGTSSPTTIGSYRSLTLSGASGSFIDLQQGGSAGGRLVGSSSGVSLETFSSVPIVFYTNSSQRAQITGSGSLLVGLSSAYANSPAGSIQYVGGAHLSSGNFGRIWVPGQSIGSVTYAGLYGMASTYNAYYDAGWKSIGGGTASAITIDEGAFSFSNSNSVGSAGAALTWTTRLTVDTNGNVGVGTSSPINFPGYRSLELRGSSTSYGGVIRLSNSNESIDTQLYNDLNGFTIGTFNDSPMRFYTWGGEVARFDSGGYFGIGTTVPRYSLHVFGDGGFTRNLTSTASRIIYMNKGRGTNTTPTNISSGDNLGAIWFCGYSGSGNNNGYGYAAYVQGEADGAVNATTVPGRLTFATTTSGNSSPTERMRINSSGDVLVNTSTTFGKFSVYGTTGFNADANAAISGSGSFKFRGVAAGTTITTYDYLNYTAVQFIRDNGNPTNTVGSITCTDTATTYNTSSDRRLKKDIVPAGDAGAVIDAIEIVSHGWKASEGTVPFGVIAQDLHAVAPQAVHAGDDGEEVEDVWGVDYSKLVPMLVKEVQSLRARVAQLEGK